VSLFQAQLEFVFFCPPVLRTASLKDKREFLETFWDSSAPRLGEEGAGGWDAWMDRKGDVQPLVPVSSSQGKMQTCVREIMIDGMVFTCICRIKYDMGNT